MNTTEFTARPTEYSGVVFRSKCEAIFARNLDLRKFSQWEYEPFGGSEWAPDFWAILPKKTGRGFFSVFIEYKPASVTDTYKTELRERFLKLIPEPNPHAMFLCCGSPYNSTRESFMLGENGWKDIEDRLRILRCLEEAKTFRFDLK